jgi:hypothetical protein
MPGKKQRSLHDGVPVTLETGIIEALGSPEKYHLTRVTCLVIAIIQHMGTNHEDSLEEEQRGWV